MSAHNDKKYLILPCIVAALASLCALMAASTVAAEPGLTQDDDSNLRRFALIVANNDSVDPGVEPLQYADDDGARYFEMFSSLSTRAELLTTLDSESQRVFPGVTEETRPPTRTSLKLTVESLKADIKQARKAGYETEMYVVFTGHGNVGPEGNGYLSLADSKLERDELFRQVIEPLGADFTHLIIDACHAYFMVNSRGGSGDDWEDDRSGQTLNRQLNAYLTREQKESRQTRRTVGVIVSTAGTAEVHEWSKFRGGVFSHELRSGLLGAADANGDGQVTYPEIEAYLVAANAAVTNPKAKINVYAEAPAQDRSRPLTELGAYEEATLLTIPGGVSGRYHLEDARGVRYADFHVDGSVPTRIALLREPLGQDGGYYLQHDGQQAYIPLTSDDVTSAKLAYSEVSQQARGSVDEAFRSDLFKTPFGPSFVAGFDAGRRNAEMTSAGGSGAEPKQWDLEPYLAVGGATALDISVFKASAQFETALDMTFRHESGWGVGPFASYGVAFERSDDGASRLYNLHRVAAGISGSYRWQLTPVFDLTPRLRAGYQVVISGADTASSDPLGARVGASLSAGFQFNSGLSAIIEGGVAGDIYTVSTATEVEENFQAVPFGRIGLRF